MIDFYSLNTPVWVIADTHFGHKNVIKYDQRPFSSVEEMNEALIENWNTVVGPDDEVWHLGDFSFGAVEFQKTVFQRLNGKKALILGNHDGSVSRCKRVGWEEVVEEKWMEVDGDRVLLCHDPLHAPQEGEYCIHGHLHKKTTLPQGICVSCNLLGYKPVDLRVVLHQLFTKIDKS